MIPVEIVQQMTIEEKVGQLFIVPACPDRHDYHLQDLETLFKDYHVDAIIYKQGTQKSYNDFKLPPDILRVGDAEWGTSMRVKDAVKFPRNLTLGAIQDLSLIEKFGRQVGWECRQLGIDINLAPVADVNTNPKNPIIGTRSFGDDPERVALLVSTVVKAMQNTGTLACAKHFPGHGDVTVDPHFDLPTTRIGPLKPFQQNSAAILTAHLQIDDEIVTFSPRIVHEILRNQLHYPGLIITDALNMKAVAKYEDAALRALKAGHDLLLYGDHISNEVDTILQTTVPSAIQCIVKAVKEGEYPESLLDEHVVRILEVKQKLQARPAINPCDIATDEASQLKQTLFDNAVTVVSNAHLPLKQGIQFTCVGGEAPILKKALAPFIQEKGLRVVCVLKWDEEQIRALNPDVLIVLTSPYGLLNLPQPPTLVIGYENDPMAEESVRKVLLGEMEAKGKLPTEIWSVAGSNR